MKKILLWLSLTVLASCNGQGTNSSQAGSVLPPVAPPVVSTQSLTAATVTQWAQGNAYAPSSITVKFASAPAAGDLLAVAFWNNGQSGNGAANTYTAPSGWTVATQVTNVSWQSSQIFTHTVAAGEANSYTFKPLSATREHVFLAADINNAQLDTAAEKFLSNTSHYVSPAITPSTSSDLALGFQMPLTNNSISYSNASGWSKDEQSSQWHGEGIHAALTTLSSVSASSTLSSSVGGGFSAIVALKIKSKPTPSPSPSPTPVPTAAPTPTPTPIVSGNSPYVLNGCPIYTANDWFTTNLVTGGSSYASNTVDPNSTNMINNFIQAYGNVTMDINASSASVHLTYGPVNVAQSTTPLYVVQNTTYGWANDQWNDDPNKQIPWQSSFYSQGSCTSSNGDCHSVVMTGPSAYPAGTHPCVDYETYQYGKPSFNGSTFTAESLTVHNLNYPYNDQYTEAPGPTKANIPLLGTTDVGEDASMQSINHIALLVFPGSDSNSEAVGGWVAPASSGTSCSAYCTYKIPMGARFRLKASYTCPSGVSNPQAYKVCMQLKTYGMVLTDHGSPSGHFGIPLGPSADDSNPWNPTDIGAISSTSGNGIPLTDFEIMTLGTVH